MKKTALYQEYLERQKAKKTEVKVSHLESVTQQRLDANPQWGFRSIFELERTIGLPGSANTPLVRWSNRLPHGPDNSVWCFPALFPALPTEVAARRPDGPGPVWPFNEWAKRLGLISEAEQRYRRAIYYWSHSDRQDPTWVNRALSQEFGYPMVCNVDPIRVYASPEEFEACL